MATALKPSVATVFLNVLLNKLTDLALAEIKKVLHSDPAFEKLESTFFKTRILLMKLDTFEMKVNTNQFLQNRISTLQRLSNEAVDLMGDIKYLTCPYSGLSKRPVLKAVLRSPGKLSKPRAIFSLQRKMETILVELEELLKLISQQEPTVVASSNHVRVLGIPVIGRESDVKEITRALISCSFNDPGVSIVGMDGLGKTTLAQAIQNDASVKAHFSVILWVDVPGGYFNPADIIAKWDQLEEKELCGNVNLQSKGDNSALVIFDNMLTVSLQDWTDMWSHIRNKHVNGKIYKNIKLLITTYSCIVVENTGTRKHHLNPLCDEDSSKVIYATAQLINPSLCDLDPKNEIIHTLARNCGGFPPVASRLGALLGQYGHEKVHHVLKDLWNSDVFKREILPDLKPFYSNILPHLKPHFAYFSLFPNKYLFTAEQLVHLWCAEEFVGTSDLIEEFVGTTDLIEKAKQHFDELQGLSVLTYSGQRTRNGMRTYVLNQISHKFAQLAASKTCVQFSQGVLSPDKNTLHLSSYNNQCFPKWTELQKFKHLSTILALSKSNIGEIPPSTFKKLKHLRVLSLRGSEGFKNLPDSINRLTCLRYLDISDTPLESLPKSLSKLRALQFLKLKKETGGSLRALPKDFQNLTSMIHIDWDVSDIKHMGGLPSHIGKLSNLQTLPWFPVKNKDGHRISELKNMNNLQGSICITELEIVKDSATSKQAALEEKSFREVKLEWTRSEMNSEAKNVLTGLEPTKFLKQLEITNYGGDEFPDWMTNSLLQLEEMHLHNCPLVQGLPKHKSLPCLKLLMLEKITNVEIVNNHFFGQGHFPKLELLELTDMDKLETWNMGSESNLMPELKVLKFGTCPKLTSVSSLAHLSSLEKLEILRCAAWESLPELPVSLNHLIIIDSDLLEKRCKNGCDDWQKVDCIKNVEIAEQIIQTSGSKRHPLFTSICSYFFGWKSWLLVSLVFLFASLLWYQPRAFEKFKL